MISSDELKCRRISAQFLDTPTGVQTAVRSLCGFQAQFLSNALHAMRIRCRDFDGEAIPAGLCKNWTIRGTVHVFSEDDLGLFVRAGNGSLYRSLDFRGYTFWNQRDVWSLTPERQTYFSEVILDALKDGAMTREALKVLCRDHGMDDAFLFQVGQSRMDDIGFLFIQVVEKVFRMAVIIRLVFEKIVKIEKLAGVDVLAPVQPVDAPEIGDSRKRGDARACENNSVLRFLKQCREVFHNRSLLIKVILQRAFQDRPVPGQW